MLLRQNDLSGKSIYQFIHVDDQLEFSNCLAPLVERSQSGACDRPLNRSNSFTCRLQAKRCSTYNDLYCYTARLLWRSVL